MKKLTSLFCLCAVSLAQMGTAMADDSGTTEASNYLKLNGAVSESQYVLTVSLENTVQVRDMMFDITVPTGLTVSNVTKNFGSATSYSLLRMKQIPELSCILLKVRCLMLDLIPQY